MILNSKFSLKTILLISISDQSMNKEFHAVITITNLRRVNTHKFKGLHLRVISLLTRLKALWTMILLNHLWRVVDNQVQERSEGSEVSLMQWLHQKWNRDLSTLKKDKDIQTFKIRSCSQSILKDLGLTERKSGTSQIRDFFFLQSQLKLQINGWKNLTPLLHQNEKLN